MASLTRLNAVLADVLNTGSAADEQELFDLLLTHRPSLVKVLDVGGQSEAERKELQGGKITVDKRQMSINADFSTQAIFLGATLECSELYVAGLMQTVISRHPNVAPSEIVERVVLEHHTRRRQHVECIQLLLSAALSPTPHPQLEQFVLQQIVPGLGAKLWGEMEKMEAVIQRATTAATNAGSRTEVAGNSIRLGQDVLVARQQSLVLERRELAVDLYLVARLGRLSPQELEKTVLWLQQQPRHALTLYVLSSLLAFFDVVDPASAGATARQKLSTTPAILNLMKTRLAPGAEWKEPGLKAVLLLKWTLFLAELRRRDPGLEHKDGFQTEQLETNVWNAVQGDAFAYLSTTLARLSPSSPSPLLTNGTDNDAEPPAEDFKLDFLSSLESLARLVITHASSELRKIKQRQEDHMFASARADRARAFRSVSTSTSAPKPAAPPRNDIAAFFALLGALYTALPSERALQFWGSVPLTPTPSYAEQSETSQGKLPAFLQWSVWSTQPSDIEMCTALFGMLAGLAHGRQAAELAYNFLARGSGEVVQGGAPGAKGETVASWGWMVRVLEGWITPVPAPRGQQHQQPQQTHGHAGQFGMGASTSSAQQQQHHAPLSAKEIFLGQALLRLLGTVAAHAPGPRLALTSNTHLHILQTLTALLPLNCALELKGSALSTLKALCAPGSGTDAARATWGMLERLEVVNVRGGGSMIKKGVQSALELVEEPNGAYPQTVPFITLLAALIHTPKQRPLRALIAEDAAEANSIPDGLGTPYRVGGLGPYVAFVVEEVFLRIPGREYKDPRERWRMNDACLCFVENALAALDLGALVLAADGGLARPEMIPPLLSHPGCDILQRLLTRSPLLANLLSYAVDGVDGFDRALDRAEPLFGRTIARVLRILVRALELQQAFLDVLIPLAHALPPSPLTSTVHPRNHYTPLDSALGFSAPLAPAIAAYVAHAPRHPETALLALRMLGVLSASTVFPGRNLAVLVERSVESERVVEGFRSLLRVEARVKPEEAMEVAERYAGAGAPDAEDGDAEAVRESLLQAAKLSALEMLVEHTKPGTVYPTLSHLVLLGSTAQNDDKGLQDPRALGAKKGAVHVVLDLLSVGVGRERGTGREMLLITQPEIAEKMYGVLLNLCTHARTSDSVTRYLRTHEDFFARQLAALPPRAPEADDAGVEVVYGDGVRVRTVVSSLSSFLRARAAVCELGALDLWGLARRGHHKALNGLLGVFFGNAEDDADEVDAPLDWEDEVYGTSSAGRVGGQRSVRAVEMLQSLSFDWINALAVDPRPLELLSGLDLASCTRDDAHGCALLDRDALLSALAAARRALLSGKNAGQVDERRLSAESAYVLQSAVVENQRRIVAHAQSAGFEAWGRILRTAVAHLPPGAEADVLLADVLHEIPPLLMSEALPNEECGVVLAECAGALVGRLRAGSDGGGGGLSRERMVGTLGALVECAVGSRAEVVRGNLYAALVNYLAIVASGSSAATSTSTETALGLSTLGNSTSQSLVLSSSTRGPYDTTSALSSLRPILDRLVTSVARDASAGTEVWRTVAFTLLSRLVALDERVLNVLNKHGFVQGFVYALKEADARLVGVLKPDPDDLNALYVFEAQMGLLMRAASTRTGAERLLDAGLLPTLAGCDFIDAQPEADHAFIDRDAFLPSAIQRYHQLLLPTLQLLTQLHSTLALHQTCTAQTIRFLTSHADTLSILLKSPPSSLAALSEQKLVVELCRGVLRGVEGRERMAEHTGFGGLNAAVGALAARALAGGVGESVGPMSDAEAADDAVLAPGYAQTSKFALAVRDAEHALERALLLYLAAASDPGEDAPGGITLVVAPVVGPARSTDSRVVATVPTMGDLFDALGALSSELHDTLRITHNLTAELSARSHLRIEDYIPILPPPMASLAASQSPSQTRSMIAEELGRIRERVRRRAEGLVEAVEVALLVAWTHASVYAAEDIDSSSIIALRRPKERAGVQPGSAALARAMTGAPKGEAFVRECARRAATALSRVDGLELGGEEAWGEREAFVGLMCVRVAEVLGLSRDTSGGEE
ncbi:unnamed protein product [Peniophora sp. CBMAI 1063]|nr:unnamed protein product [Peniophora sp. CBMAI 1063]